MSSFGQRSPIEEPAKQVNATEARTSDSAFTAALDRLVALHSDGKLTDEEFRAAKERLLKGPEHIPGKLLLLVIGHIEWDLEENK